jgi:hypothetical protein
MKKTKKITDIHDYSKEVDKIIATGKPMVEQFMDLMGLMDVTFIDENQTNNRRLNKHDKSVQDKQTSDCCGAKVLSVQGYPKDEGTHYWQCSKCGAPCNIMNPCGSQTKRKRDATTGSTAKVHLNWEKEVSKNEKAKKIAGLRNLPKNAIPFDQPCELGYHCPVCKYKDPKDDYDERLEWSEYDGFLWCRVCNKDYPSCLCMPDKDKATDIYLDCLSKQKQQILEEILKHNKDDMTGLYDYDGIAETVLKLVKKL